jgi:hypothetical protein
MAPKRKAGQADRCRVTIALFADEWDPMVMVNLVCGFDCFGVSGSLAYIPYRGPDIRRKRECAGCRTQRTFA